MCVVQLNWWRACMEIFSAKFASYLDATHFMSTSFLHCLLNSLLLLNESVMVMIIIMMMVLVVAVLFMMLMMNGNKGFQSRVESEIK